MTSAETFPQPSPEIGHDWFLPKMIGYQCCRKCGVVKRLDGKNSPCRGIARIGLRYKYTEQQP